MRLIHFVFIYLLCSNTEDRNCFPARYHLFPNLSTRLVHSDFLRMADSSDSFGHSFLKFLSDLVKHTCFPSTSGWCQKCTSNGSHEWASDDSDRILTLPSHAVFMRVNPSLQGLGSSSAKITHITVRIK